MSSDPNPRQVSVSHIPILLGVSNYFEWRRAVINTLMTNALWKHVCSASKATESDFVPLFLPTPLTPSESADPAQVVIYDGAYASFVRRDGIARFIIEARLAPNITLLLPDPFTELGRTCARESWAVIECLHERRDAGQQYLLREKLSRLRMTDTCAVFLTELVRIHQQLAKMGVAVSDADGIFTIFKGLPPTWASWIEFRRNWVSIAPLSTPITFAEVAVATQAESDRLDDIAALAALQASEYANSAQALTSPTTNKSRRFCSNCKKPNHDISACWEVGGGDEGGKEAYQLKRFGKVFPEKGKGKDMKDAANLAHVSDILNDDRDYSDCYSRCDAALSSVSELDGVGFEDFALAAMGGIRTIADSGCTSHCISDRSLFRTYNSSQGRSVKTANCGILPAIARGECMAILRYQGRTTRLHLSDCLHTPSVPVNLFAVGRLDDRGFGIHLKDQHCTIRTPDADGANIILRSPRTGKLYWLDIEFEPPPFPVPDIATSIPVTGKPLPPSEMANYIEPPLDAYLWHRRCGHISADSITKLITGNYVTGVKSTTTHFADKCEACILGRHPRRPHPSTGNRASRPLELVHSDTCGPFPVQTPHAKNYFIVFLDDFTNFLALVLLRTKDEALEAWITVKARWENRLKVKVLIFRTDNAGEFLSAAFQAMLKECGIEQQLSAPYSHQQNGKAERVIRTIEGHAMSMLAEANLPLTFWGEAVETEGYLHNLTPTSTLPNDITPFEAFNKKKPDISHLRVWGSRCFVRVPKELQLKGGPRSTECLFMGYPGGVLGYRVRSSAGRFFNSRDIFFDEGLYSLTPPEPTPALAPPAFDDPIEPEQPHAPTEQPPPELPLPELLLPHLPRLSDGNVRRSRDIPIPFASPVNSKRVSVRTSKGKEWDDGVTAAKEHLARVRTRAAEREAEHEVGEATLPVENPPVAPVVMVTEADAAALAFSREFALFVGERGDDDGAEIDESFCILEELAYIAHKAPTRGYTKDYDLNIPPKNYAEAVSRSDAEKWREAMKEEMDGFEDMGVYEVVDLPQGRRAVGCRWVYSFKRDIEGTITTYKARLVAQGFSQIPGLDFDKTFAPVCRLSTVRTVVAFATQKNYHLHLWDAIKAFLNGKIDAEIYMKLAPGFFAGLAINKVLRLLRSVYGLRQSSRVWYCKLRAILEALGFRRSDLDHCLFILVLTSHPDPTVHCTPAEPIHCLITVHVDDGLTACNSLPYLEWLKKDLASKVGLKDLGPVEKFLGMEFRRNMETRETWISQYGYIDSLLQEHGLLNAKSATVPLEGPLLSTPSPIPPGSLPGVTSATDIKPAFQHLVGSLLYLSLCTRPDITYAVQTLSQFNSNPLPHHLLAAKHVLRYLKGTRDLCLHYGGARADEGLYAFTDANWATSPEDRISISGFVWFFAGGPIIWVSRKQKTVALSSTESEYMALALTIQEGLWLRMIFRDIDIPLHLPLSVRCDNQGAIFLSSESSNHSRAKHIDIKYHFIREYVDKGIFEAVFVPTAKQTADIFTKPLARILHSRHVAGLSLVSH